MFFHYRMFPIEVFMVEDIKPVSKGKRRSKKLAWQ
jgi:hypothetical protein